MNVQANRRFLSSLGLIALLYLPSMTAGVSAAPVSSERAETVARNWMLLQTGVVHRATRVESPAKAGAGAATEQPKHILIETEPAGWVIVAGDDTSYPVLGYANGSTIAGKTQPPSFVNWMRLVDGSIAEAARRTAAGAPQPDATAQAVAQTIAQAWTELGQGELPPSTAPRPEGSVGAVAPLIQTTWSQERFYNAACPPDAESPNWYDGRAPVGCCATAMGQIMRYYAYPATGTGSNSYYHRRYGTLAANFGATEYQWAAMPASGRLTSYNNAVALLLRHAGIAVNMNYGPKGSACRTDMIAPALRNYFRYAAEYAQRIAFSDTAWITKIKADLNARRPIWYAGTGPDGAHAFVLDGYKDPNFFHFNWGWNGYYDGYFLLSNLNPGGSSFTSSQDAVFGIRPTWPRPVAARLISPSGIIATHTPTYAWTAVGNARRYYLWVDDPTSGENGKIKIRYSAAQVGCGGGTGICSVKPTTPLASGPATWWIQTWNEAGDGPWSAPMGFHVSVAPPGPATPLNPSGTIRTTLPTYTWPAVSGATAYMLWVDDVTSGEAGKIQTWYSAAQAACGSGSGTCAVTPETALANGPATWWIQTRNAFGFGPWSAPKTFTVSAVGAATLIDPNGRVPLSMPTYRWQPVPGATWYQLWVDDVTSGWAGKIQIWYTESEAACASGRCSVKPAIPLVNGPATWWIQTWNDAGYGSWSDAMDFEVDAP
jgi:hypothetical protein